MFLPSHDEVLKKGEAQMMKPASQQFNQLLVAGLLIAVGAMLMLMFQGAMHEKQAHAQGQGPGGVGYGTGGIPAVLDRIDVMEEAMHLRLDAIDAELAEIRDTVTPRAFDATVDICFELAGGFEAAAGIGLERQWGLEGFLGIDFYGNGAKITIPPALAGLIPLPSGLGSQAGAQLGGSAGLGAQFCIAFPFIA
jgi:hypothetical protein